MNGYFRYPLHLFCPVGDSVEFEFSYDTASADLTPGTPFLGNYENVDPIGTRRRRRSPAAIPFLDKRPVGLCLLVDGAASKPSR